jgi:hypothetical protein
VGALIAWLVTGTHPQRAVTLTMLGLVSAALGGQSIWALRIHQTTTYFTGMLTTAINVAAGGSAARLAVGARQLCALVAGAALGGLLLHDLRPASPALPLLFLAAATAIQVVMRPPRFPPRRPGGRE